VTTAELFAAGRRAIGTTAVELRTSRRAGAMMPVMVEELGQLGELVAAERVVFVLIKSVKQSLQHFGGRATAGAAEIARAMGAAVALFALAIFGAWSALAVTLAVWTSTTEPLAHCVAGRLAFPVTQFAVAVLVELFEHSLAHLRAAWAITFFAVVFRRLSQCRQCHQARDRDAC
jgi:hypothetical protein